jgi:hypothetical protein
MSDYKFIEQFKIEIVNQMIELGLSEEDKLVINKYINTFISEVEHNIEECLNDIKRMEKSHKEQLEKLNNLIITIKTLVGSYECIKDKENF